jgi:hypothetical protein
MESVVVQPLSEYRDCTAKLRLETRKMRSKNGICSGAASE